jgi:hypothetical protein
MYNYFILLYPNLNVYNIVQLNLIYVDMLSPMFLGITFIFSTISITNYIIVELNIIFNM